MTLTLKDGSEMSIRQATPGDAEALCRFSKLVAGQSPLNVSDEEVKAERLALIELQPGDLMLIAESSGGIVGFLGMQARRQAKLAHIAVLGMAVASSHWRLGVGKALLSTAIEHARATSLRKLSAEVLATNVPCLKMCAQAGFIEEGRRVAEVKVGSSYVDLVLLHLPLLTSNK